MTMINKNAMKMLALAGTLMPPADVMAFIVTITQAINGQSLSRLEMLKVRAAREASLAAIRSKHDLYRELFDHLFGERNDAIHKYF